MLVYFYFVNVVPTKDTCHTLTEHAEFNFKKVVKQAEDLLLKNLLNCGELALSDPLGQDLINFKVNQPSSNLEATQFCTGYRKQLLFKKKCS